MAAKARRSNRISISKASGKAMAPRGVDALAKSTVILNLTKAETTAIFGVTERTIDKWRKNGVPLNRIADVDRITEIAELLEARFVRQRIPAIVREALPGLNERSMLEEIRAGAYSSVADLLDRAFSYDLDCAGLENSPKHSLKLSGRDQVSTAACVSDSEYLEAMKNLAGAWQLRHKERCLLLGVSSSTSFNFTDRRRHLSADLRDRISQLANIEIALRSIFNDGPMTHGWLRRPNEAFGERSPLDVMMQDGSAGIVRIQAYLQQLQ